MTTPLDREQVARIRYLHNKHGYTMKSLAEQFYVTAATIANVVHGRGRFDRNRMRREKYRERKST